MKLTVQVIGVIVLTVSVAIIGGWVLQYMITQWLLTFGIVTSVDFWLCVLTNLYLVILLK